MKEMTFTGNLNITLTSADGMTYTDTIEKSLTEIEAETLHTLTPAEVIDLFMDAISEVFEVHATDMMTVNAVSFTEGYEENEGYDEPDRW